MGSLFDYALPALRAVPWLVSLLAAYWVYRAARMLLDRRAATLVTAVSALNPMAVRYAIEFKQYGVEMALGALFVYLVLRVSRLGYRSADIVWLGLTATAGFLFSNTVPLLLAAFGPVLFVHNVWVNRGLRRPSVELAVAGVVAGVVTGIYYWALARPLLLYQFEGYDHVYQEAYALHSLMAIPWLAEHLYTVVFSTLGPPDVVKPLYLPLAMIGGWPSRVAPASWSPGPWRC